LLPNTQYNFTVKAINAFGSSAVSSPVATATTTNVVPGAPTIGTATPGISSVTVTWSPPTNTGSPITGYKVFYGTSANLSTDFVSALSTDTSVTVTGLNPGTLYFFNVVAVNAAGPGSASSEVSTTTTDVLPGAPILDSVVPGNGSVAITWHAGADTGSPVSTYKVYRNGTAVPVYTGLPLTYTDVHLVNGIDYSYTVVATNLKGDSPSSNTVHATPDVVPGTPVLGTITVGLNSVTVSWSAPYNAGSSITGYEVFYGTTTNPTQQYGGLLSASTFQLNLTGLIGGTTYHFVVKAINAAGDGPASNEITATTTSSVPGTISGLVAIVGDNNVTLTWNVPSTGGSPIQNYSIYRGVNSTMVLIGKSTTTSFVDSAITAGVIYDYTVKAVNSIGEGEGATITGVTVPLPALPKIAGVIATQDGSPLSGAKVSLENGSYILTDANGRFNLTASTGQHTLTISGSGFKTTTIDVTLTQGNKDVGTIKLESSFEDNTVLIEAVAGIAGTAIILLLLLVVWKRKKKDDKEEKKGQ